MTSIRKLFLTARLKLLINKYIPRRISVAKTFTESRTPNFWMRTYGASLTIRVALGFQDRFFIFAQDTEVLNMQISRRKFRQQALSLRRFCQQMLVRAYRHLRAFGVLKRGI